jgi:transcription elongation factor Elf1
MKMNYHRVRFLCPDCRREITVTGILGRADGHILFEGLCVHCGEERQTELHNVALIIHAYQMDVNECKQKSDPMEDLMLEEFAKLDGSKKVH